LSFGVGVAGMKKLIVILSSLLCNFERREDRKLHWRDKTTMMQKLHRCGFVAPVVSEKKCTYNLFGAGNHAEKPQKKSAGTEPKPKKAILSTPVRPGVEPSVLSGSSSRNVLGQMMSN
jgi:hypothetical protein